MYIKNITENEPCDWNTYKEVYRVLLHYKRNTHGLYTVRNKIKNP